ncbi:CLIP domain-containing serine protease 14D-like [Hyalella azteca]|uniref:CLIP domain-containing serine protease 14D-like n=1 Tax=Hyalella azteca TaxID=294128 RepID=A0A8B7N9U0_HYAAZ|nr:CLIP domain-containing serine protease 14D-like [Hyalella azteca]
MRNPVSTNVPNIKALRLLPDSFTTWSLTNQVGRVAGWGSTGTVVSSEILYQTTMTIDNRFCQGLSVFNPDSQLCLMGVSGSDICSGDSGTPLSLDAGGFRYLVGVISRNLDCSGRNPTFAGFVSYYYKWIVDTIAEYGGSNDAQYGV